MAAIVVASLWALCAKRGTAEPPEASSEYALKAAFLFHFAQFVEWPEGTFREADRRLVYCTVGTDPFRGELEETLKGKTLGGHGFEVRHLRQARDTQGCHLVFLGEDQKREVAATAAQLREAPVLLVGESEGFTKDGGMIGFLVEDNKVRFEVNLEAAQKAGLKINARLLALAKTVIGGPKRSG